LYSYVFIECPFIAVYCQCRARLGDRVEAKVQVSHAYLPDLVPRRSVLDERTGEGRSQRAIWATKWGTAMEAYDIRSAFGDLGEVEFRTLATFNRGTIGVFWASIGVSPWERHPDDEGLLQVVEGSEDDPRVL
jgi:hypothetical protein